METWTVKDLLDWTTDFFQKKEIESPRLEAEILLAEAMKLKRIDLFVRYDQVVTDDQRTVYREFVKKRGAGEPVAYIVGYKEFYSLKFSVNRSVLIPRPETETLVLETIDRIKVYQKICPTTSQETPIAVCDVGTGSGAIIVALAHALSKTKGPQRNVALTAVDLSEESLAVAKANSQTHQVAQKISFQKSDLLESVAGPFDFIVSNPPYISEAEFEALPSDVKNYEPKAALLAGPTGLEVVERLVRQAKAKLTSGGFLLVEISPMIADKTLALLSDWQDVEIVKDLAGLRRIVIARTEPQS